MKKITLLLILILALVLPSIVLATDVVPTSVEMTAKQLIETAEDGKITLDKDITLTDSLSVPSGVTTFDLGHKTLTLKKGIVVNSSLEIKNGTVERDAAFTTNSMIVVDGATVDFKLDGVTIDGKEVPVTHPAGEQGSALLVKSGNDITLNNSIIVNHVFSFAGIVSVFDSENIYVINTKISDNEAKNVGILTVAYSGNFEFNADSVISNNSAKEAAGMHIEYTDATIAGTIEGNSTLAGDGNNGGGLYVFLNDQWGSNDKEKTVTITDTAKIINNTAAGAGGGVYVTGVKEDALTGKVVMKGGVISGNYAEGTPQPDTLKDGGGAGIYVARGNMTIKGGDINNNHSDSNKGNAILVSNQGKNTQSSGKLEITGGSIVGSIALGVGYGSINITGGNFDEEPIGIAEGYRYFDHYVRKEHEIKIEAPNGTVTTNKNKAVAGEFVSISAIANEGYVNALENFISVVDASGNKIEVTNNGFIMNDSSVTVKVKFDKLYNIILDCPENVDVSARETMYYNPINYARAGEKIRINAGSKIEGYDVKCVIVKDAKNNEIKYNNVYFIDITMPESDITVTAEIGKVTQEVGKLPSQVPETTELEKNLLASLQEFIENSEEGSEAEMFIAECLKNSSVIVEVEVKDKEVKDSEKEEIEKAIEKKVEGIKVGKYIDITINVKDKMDSEWTITELEELKEEITFTVVIPEELPKVADGYKREYYIVRNHNGIIDILDSTVSEDGKSLNFASNLFSTYAIAYKDVKEEAKNGETTKPTQTPTTSTVNPEEEKKETVKENAAIGPVTGDDITIYVASLIISIMGIVVLRKLNISKKH